MSCATLTGTLQTFTTEGLRVLLSASNLDNLSQIRYESYSAPVPNGQFPIFISNLQEPLDSSRSNMLKNCTGRFVSKGRLVANVEAMVEDFSVIGSGIVKEVVCAITS